MSRTKRERFLEDEARFTGHFSRHVMATIAESFKPYKWGTWTCLVIGIVARLCLLSTANITGYWADSLCTSGSYCHEPPAFLASFSNLDFLRLLSLVVLVGFVCNLIFRIGISRIGAKAVSTLYDETTMRVSRLPMDFFDRTPVGRIMSRFSSDYAAIFRMAGGPLGEFLGIAFDLFATLVLLAIASVYYLPVVFLAAACYTLLYRLNVPRMRYHRRQFAAARSPSVAHFAETVQGARLVKVYGKTGTFIRRFESMVQLLLKERFALAFSTQGYSLQMAFVTALMLFITGLGGIVLISQHKVSTGSLATAFTFIMIVSTTIQQFFEWLANLEDALTGVERMDNYLRRPMELGALLPPKARFSTHLRRSDPGWPRVSHGIGARVGIRNLWLRYAPDLPWVLQGIDIDIAAGERIAIIGRTGSGKSTLIQALYHLYPFQEGSITVDGHRADLSAADRSADPDAVPLEQFRRLIALIPQEPTLFRGRLRDNLVADEPSDEKIWDILRAIGLEQWVRGLAHGQGLAYPVEERGSNLSAGQRQLLCMARCFLAEAPVIITDEATSAIDPASEELLVRALDERTRGRTLIIVAHRLSTVKGCDRVLWLDQGRVRMLGTPDEVLPVFTSTELH